MALPLRLSRRLFSRFLTPTRPLLTDLHFNEHEIYLPSFKNTHVPDMEAYQRLYNHSITDPESFWSAKAMDLVEWYRPWQGRALLGTPDNVSWFMGGKLNVCANAVDRHLDTRADKTAILWIGDDPQEHGAKHITYRQLHYEVCRLANGLTSLGLQKGDTCLIYMPAVPELIYTMLACARLGVVHSVVFAGFSAKAIVDRIKDSGAKFVVTSNIAFRAGKAISLKSTVDQACTECPEIRNVVVFERAKTRVTSNLPDISSSVITSMRTGLPITYMHHPRDIWYHDLVSRQRGVCPPVTMDAEDPLFVLYTSGSTGKPKGLLHTCGGYLTYAMYTHKVIFDLREEDVYGCMADCGWITGHTYIVYGPLSNGATTVLFESTPVYPDASRYWKEVEKHKISILYTAPTAIRTLMKFGSDPVRKHDRSSLRVLASVGEPINPEAWRWFYDVVGEKRCPIADTYWQTETGGVIFTSIAGCHPMKPGCAAFPFFGVKPATVGTDVLNNVTGPILCAPSLWPGVSRTVIGDHKRYQEVYFGEPMRPSHYVTGDGAWFDSEGFMWVTGRMDDVINKCGHRIGSAEIESALVSAADEKGSLICAEAAVVAIPHEVTGEAIIAFCTLRQGFTETPETVAFLKQSVKAAVGGLATPDWLIITPQLPKTASQKIMRRLLRKIGQGQNTLSDLGDLTTLVNPESVPTIIEKAQTIMTQTTSK